MIYTETTHGKRERENKPPRERERERVPLLCYVFTLFLMCACINIGRRLSSCAFVFLTPFSSRGDFCLFFRSSFFLSLLLLKIWFFLSFFSHTADNLHTDTFTYILFLSFFVCASTCEDSFFIEKLRRFLDLVKTDDKQKKTQKKHNKKEVKKKQKRGARVERHRLRTSHTLVLPCARREEKKK